jgi:hypothetical protein
VRIERQALVWLGAAFLSALATGVHQGCAGRFERKRARAERKNSQNQGGFATSGLVKICGLDYGKLRCLGVALGSLILVRHSFRHRGKAKTWNSPARSCTSSLRLIPAT